MTSSAPLRVLGTIEQMGLFAVERLDGARPVAAMRTLNGFACVFRIDGLELRVRVIVWWTRHVEWMDGCVNCWV